MDIGNNLILVPYYVSANGTRVDYTQILAGFDYRTMGDIVRICLLTMFTYTWATLHPNIPSRRGLFYRIWYMANLMLVAFVMPDLIILWSAKQYWASHALGMQYEKYGWTQTHGFFALMGGYEDDSGRTLSPYSDNFQHALRLEKLNITQDEIRDRGKPEILLKTLSLIQVSWFIITFLFRGISPTLFTTELEVITFAYIIPSIANLYFWWNKPQNVERPVRVHLFPDAQLDALALPKRMSSILPPSQNIPTLAQSSCFQLATSLMWGDSDAGTLMKDSTVSPSVLHTFYGDLCWKDMAKAFASTSTLGLVYCGIFLTFGVIGFNQTNVIRLLWISSALVGSVMPLNMVLVTLYSCLPGKRNGLALHRAVNGRLGRAMWIGTLIGRLSLLSTLIYYMTTPYGYKAYLSASFMKYVPHIF